MGELIYELDTTGRELPLVWVGLAAFTLVGCAILLFPRLTEIGFVRRFTFGLKGRWIGLVPIVFMGVIAIAHFFGERLFVREALARLESGSPTIVTGCLQAFHEDEISGFIRGVMIDDQTYRGVGLHNWQRLMSSIQSEFSLGDAIRIEHVGGDIIRVWRPESGAVDCSSLVAGS